VKWIDGEGTSATFELFNLFSDRPDWVLDVRGEPRLRITGTTGAPALPGPSTLDVAYIDEPRGHKPIGARLTLVRIDVARVRVEGDLQSDGDTFEIALTAALVT
jgi:hypothetical protein